MVSVTELLLSAMPYDLNDTWIGNMIKAMLNTFMTSTLWAQYFPSLKADLRSSTLGEGQMSGKVRPLDLRCGFSKAFLEGKLTDTHIT